MKTVVFPTDFSDMATQALPVAAQVARLLNAELHLVHVLAPVLPSYTPRLHRADDQYALALGRVEQAFDDLLRQPCLSGLCVKIHVLTGTDPADWLNNDRLAKADLLVMASTGASGLKEIFLGSNAEHLIRRATMPVLVLKKPPRYLEIKTVVFASDFQDPRETPMGIVNEIIDGFDYPAIHLLFVNTLRDFVPTHTIQPRMEAFARHYGLQGCIVSQENEFDVETGLLAFARNKKADLIVLGTHQRHGLRHLLGGSIAEDVANHAPVAVLTLPLREAHTPMVNLEGLGTGII